MRGSQENGYAAVLGCFQAQLFLGGGSLSKVRLGHGTESGPYDPLKSQARLGCVPGCFVLSHGEADRTLTHARKLAHRRRASLPADSLRDPVSTIKVEISG